MTKVNAYPMKFRWFDIDKADKTGMTVLHDWEQVYNFQKEDSPPGSFTNKIATLYVWSASGYDQKENRAYGGMFAYSEVWCEEANKVECEQFFGETSESDALRWANDISNKMLYNNYTK